MSPGRELKERRKKQWEKRAKESPSGPARKFAKYLTSVHSFFGLILVTEKGKDRRTPTGLCNSYWDSADNAFGTY